MELSVVELPGKSVSKDIKNIKSLDLTRNTLGIQHENYIQGAKVQTNSILIKINRSTKEIKIIGKVSNAIRFRALADFQANSFDCATGTFNDDVEELRDNIVNLNFDKIREFTPSTLNHQILAPPAFCKPNWEFSYHFKENSAIHTIKTQDPNTGENIYDQKYGHTKPQDSTAISINSNDPMPEKPTFKHSSDSQKSLRDARIEKISAGIEKLFQKRPIWTRRAICHELAVSQMENPLVIHALSNHAYTFMNGIIS